jgi:hypothetical protein
MPTDNGFGLDDDEGLGPTGPTATEGNPEDPIQPLQFGPWTVAFEYCELLPQGQNLEGVITPTSNEHAERGKAGEDRFDEHKPILITMLSRRLGWARTFHRKVLILGQDQVLATNNPGGSHALHGWGQRRTLLDSSCYG